VVLVVDDVEANVLLLELLLTRAGAARVVGITDPRQTIEQYNSIDPDLILLDLHMPQLDGHALLEALGQVIPGGSFTPIVVLTADSTFEARQRALALGANDFLTKPFEQVEVLLRVNNLLHTRRLHLALQRHNTALQAEIWENTEQERRLAEERDLQRSRIQRILQDRQVTMVFQPIVDLATGRTAGVEALARFDASPARPPDQWFAEAAAVGLGTELELLAVSAAVDQIDRLPADTYMSINASPHTALDHRLAETLAPVASRIVLEITEHEAVTEYPDLLRALDGLRETGVRLAIDDAGSGYSSLQHILRLNPDIIKLDIELTRGIDADPARRALAEALVIFAREIGAVITAEGIETTDELSTLRRVGAQYGQGYYLARPGPLPLTPRANTIGHTLTAAM
jgi:EAL domain-containing protein (putative c-di-GMP-specific phosphodiesterase class I)/FixJ family two-component response regulator